MYDVTLYAFLLMIIQQSETLLCVATSAAVTPVVAAVAVGVTAVSVVFDLVVDGCVLLIKTMMMRVAVMTLEIISSFFIYVDSITEMLKKS